MEATSKALSSYVEECDKYGVPRERIIVTATEASRVANNAREFFNQMSRQLNIKVNIITSDAEAYLSTLGVLFGTDFTSEKITIIDIGGLYAGPV